MSKVMCLEIGLDDLLKSESVDEELSFVDLTRREFSKNKYILNKYFRNEQGHDCAFANLLRIEDKSSLYKIKKELKRDFKQKVSLKGYKYDPKHYVYSDIYNQLEYEEEYYRTPDAEEERRLENSKLINVSLDYDLVDKLSKIIETSYINNIVMLLNLDTAYSLINTGIELDLKGFDCTSTNNAITRELHRIDAYLADEELCEFLKSNTDNIFDYEDRKNVYSKIAKNFLEIEIPEEYQEVSYYEDSYEDEYEDYLD